ncbi:hypothetical protein GF322_00110 [Candidatus Dependentiae bacterium]|nr:hypothetical protein [Candidatus Dependentiae bacterium]
MVKNKSYNCSVNEKKDFEKKEEQQQFVQKCKEANDSTFIGIHMIDEKLLTEFAKQINDIINAYPEIEHTDTNELFLNIDSSFDGLDFFDIRSVRVILEERLKHVENMILEIQSKSRDKRF